MLSRQKTLTAARDAETRGDVHGAIDHLLGYLREKPSDDGVLEALAALGDRIVDPETRPGLPPEVAGERRQLASWLAGLVPGGRVLHLGTSDGSISAALGGAGASVDGFLDHFGRAVGAAVRDGSDAVTFATLGQEEGAAPANLVVVETMDGRPVAPLEHAARLAEPGACVAVLGDGPSPVVDGLREIVSFELGARGIAILPPGATGAGLRLLRADEPDAGAGRPTVVESPADAARAPATSGIADPITRSIHRPRKVEAIRSFLDFAGGGAMPRYPLEVFLEVSNVCDLKCAMCHTFSALNPNRFLNLRMEDRGFLEAERAVSSLEAILPHALMVHCFGYGEPTIHPEFRTFLERMLSYEVLVDFFTNGMHLDDDLCEFLVEKRVFRVTVSFSGATREDYENVYMGGDWDRVLGGLRRLDEAKRRAGSAFPRIDINSLAFRHHVERIPEFVDLMAEHGANVIELKNVNGNELIPQLHDHIAVMRPWVEGPLIAEAKQRAARHGIVFNAAPFEAAAVRSEEEVEARRKGRIAPPGHRGVAGGSAVALPGAVPITDLRKVAKDVRPVRPENPRPEPPPSVLERAGDAAREALDLRAPEREVASPCFEPFKTMYVKQDGRVKTCCFAGPDPAMGHVGKHEARAIWEGDGFRLTREAILDGRYPMATCHNCIEMGNAPRHHGVQHIVGAYLDWYRGVFATELDARVASEAARLEDNDRIVSRHRLGGKERS